METETKKLVSKELAAIVLFGGIAIFLLLGTGHADTHADALDKIRETNQIDACYISYPPISSKNISTGKIEGIGVEILESIAQKMGAKVNYVETTWANIALDLRSGRCEINVAGPYNLVERGYGGVVFSNPIGYAGNNALVKKGDKRFTSLEQLNNENVTVAVTEGEASHLWAKLHLPKAKLLVMSTGDISLAFQQVLSGRADVALGDATTIELFLRENDDLERMLKKDYLVRELTLPVNEDDLKFINFINNAISGMRTSGELAEIYSKYNYDSITLGG